MTVSVIIPVLNAAHTITHLLDALQTQSCIPDEIIIADSSSDDGTAELCAACPGVSVISIRRRDFNHASTRDIAIRAAKGDICILMTQDAVPVDDHLIENLISPLDAPSVCMAYGRQLPKADASLPEKLIREYNYPAESFLRSSEDIPIYGLKTFFFSDVCAAYRKADYLLLGGFEPSLPANEDMLFAAKAIRAGYKTAYVSNACVYHSHDFSFRSQYRRYKSQAAALEMHRDLLEGTGYSGEGIKLFRHVSSALLKQGKLAAWGSFCADCSARALGHLAGKRAAWYSGNKKGKFSV